MIVGARALRPRCPSLDPRRGPRAFAGALAHLVSTRGHASCALERIGIALIATLVAQDEEIQGLSESLSDAVGLLRRAAAFDERTRTKWLH